jgi:hypothetical protein
VREHHRDAPLADDHLTSVRAPPPHPRFAGRADRISEIKFGNC